MAGPLLKAIKALKKPSSIYEHETAVAKMFDIPQEEFESHQGERTKLGYKLAWARTYLKRLGFIESPARGVWSITSEGRKAAKLSSGEIISLIHAMVKKEKVAAALRQDAN
jgi:restriction system protein